MPDRRVLKFLAFKVLLVHKAQLVLRGRRVPLVHKARQDRWELKDLKAIPAPPVHRDLKVTPGRWVPKGLRAQPVLKEHKDPPDYKVRRDRPDLKGLKATPGPRDQQVRRDLKAQQGLQDHRVLRDLRALRGRQVPVALRDRTHFRSFSPYLV
jgi:hypothetical protein